MPDKWEYIPGCYEHFAVASKRKDGTLPGFAKIVSYHCIESDAYIAAKKLNAELGYKYFGVFRVHSVIREQIEDI